MTQLFEQTRLSVLPSNTTLDRVKKDWILEFKYTVIDASYGADFENVYVTPYKKYAYFYWNAVPISNGDEVKVTIAHIAGRSDATTTVTNLTTEKTWNKENDSNVRAKYVRFSILSNSSIYSKYMPKICPKDIRFIFDGECIFGQQ